MSDDWQPGDLALCVRGGKLIPSGAVHRVVSVLAPRPWQDGQVRDAWHGPGLIFEGIKHPKNRWLQGAFAAKWFRKIRPHEADEEDRETIALLNGAPVPLETTP